MNASLQIAAMLAQTAEPFLPFTSVKMLSMLNLEKRSWNEIEASETLLAAGHTLGQTELLFDKIEDEAVEFQLNKLNETKRKNQMTNPNAPAQKEECTFDDFQKTDLRVGTIVEAKKVEKADKLLELRVDTGLDIRTVVSGIAESFSPEEVIGKKCTILVNLAPRKIRGIESQGMLLFTDLPNGKLAFVNPEGDAENGSQIA